MLINRSIDRSFARSLRRILGRSGLGNEFTEEFWDLSRRNSCSDARGKKRSGNTDLFDWELSIVQLKSFQKCQPQQQQQNQPPLLLHSLASIYTTGDLSCCYFKLSSNSGENFISTCIFLTFKEMKQPSRQQWLLNSSLLSLSLWCLCLAVPITIHLGRSCLWAAIDIFWYKPKDELTNGRTKGLKEGIRV